MHTAMRPKRETVGMGIRIDKRIADILNNLAEKKRRKRNWLIEQILGKMCGLDNYNWKEEELGNDDEMEAKTDR